MLNQDLTHFEINNRCLKEKIKIVIGLMKDELNGKIIEEFRG